MPTFNGKHGWMESQALYTLYKLEKERNIRNLNISEWQFYSGLRYEYLNSRICPFNKWRWITRTTKVYGNRPCFGYSLGREGLKWLKRWVLTVPSRVEELERRLPKHENEFKALFMRGII